MKKFNELKWKAFKIDEIFNIFSGKRLTKECMKEGDTPFVGSTDSNNGITAFCGNENESVDSNVLGVNYNGSVVENFYHPYKALFSDDVKRLHLKDVNDNLYVCLFIKVTILQQKKKFEYGYKFNGHRMEKQYILLPATSDGSPDYAYMEEYMRSVEKELLSKYSRYIASRELGGVTDDVQDFKYLKWKAFELDKLFEIHSTSSSIDKKKLNGVLGTTPYITRSGGDNGIGLFVGEQKKYKKDNGNVITIGLDTQTVCYQPSAFYTGQNIQILSNNNINRYTALFVIPLIKKQMVKFNWGGNGATLGRLKKLCLLLPATSDDDPDYAFMEKYMKRQESKLLGLYAANKLKEYHSEEDSRML